MDVLAKDDPTLTETGFKAELTKKSDKKEEKKASIKTEPVSISLI
jgi:hypothetical protein